MGIIKKAVIPAAGWGTRFLPATKSIPKGMLPVVDKPAIQYIVEEALEAGIEDIAIVIGENTRAIARHFAQDPELEAILIERNKMELMHLLKRINQLGPVHFIEQKQALGLGHSVWCARHFVGNEPFAVLLGDMICDGPDSGIGPLMEIYRERQANVIGVTPVPWPETEKFGIVTGDYVDDHLYAVKELIEKPRGVPPSNLAIMGRYILDPHIFGMIELTAAGAGGEIQLTDALQRQLSCRKMYARIAEGETHDVGCTLGFLKANISLALKQVQLKEELAMYLHKCFSALGVPLAMGEREP